MRKNCDQHNAWKRGMMHTVSKLLLLLLIGSVLAACAASQSPNAAFLLEQDYTAMSDQELIVHEQELSDEILHATNSSNGGVSLGIGVGSWGRHSGVGVGVDQRLGGSTNQTYRELWQRREAVRAEMRQRGLMN
jgi:hypothetical protein